MPPAAKISQKNGRAAPPQRQNQKKQHNYRKIKKLFDSEKTLPPLREFFAFKTRLYNSIIGLSGKTEKIIG